MFGKKDPAVQMIEAFTAELDRKGVRYSANKEKKLVSITYDNDHYKNQAFTFFFDDDGASFYVRAYSIEKFTKSQLDDAYAFCNQKITSPLASSSSVKVSSNLTILRSLMDTPPPSISLRPSPRLLHWLVATKMSITPAVVAISTVGMLSTSWLKDAFT